MRVRSRPLLFLLLALTLLFAQQGAAVHALSHLSEPLPSHSQQDKQLPHSPACDQCVVYAGVGSALAASAWAIPALVAQAPHFDVAPTALLSQPTWLYHARAPPALV